MNSVKSFWKQMDKDKSKDTGMAIILVLLILSVILKRSGFAAIAIIVLVLNMIQPLLFKPFAFLWFGLARGMGFVMSRFLLTVTFFIVVTPVGLIRRAACKDPLKLRLWKKGRESVFTARDYTYRPDDIKNPY